MTRYLLNRILRSLFSIVIVVAVVMFLIYSCLDRELIFANDNGYVKTSSHARTVHKMQKWEEFGYIDYVPYSDYLQGLRSEIGDETFNAAAVIADQADKDTEIVAQYVAKFTQEYQEKGYEVIRLDAEYMPKTTKYKNGGEPRLYAYKDISLPARLWGYFSGIINVDNIHDVKADIEDRGLSFVWRDPAYGGEKFSPAIMGNGTTHKYLLYFDNIFPYVHQNLVKINLGKSSGNGNYKGRDVFEVMTTSQGSFDKSLVTYPSGYAEESADDIHSLTYVAGSYTEGDKYYVDDYTNVSIKYDGMSKMGYSFVIGIISVIMAYVLAIPLGTMLALKKDKFVDKLGTLYIVFIIAVPSLAYIFIFKALGGMMGLPTVFRLQNPTWLMYILPIISLALPSVAGLMKWLRRYMIDQMNSDYVKFARSGGLSEGEIFRKHILKNAIIPIAHGIPGALLGSIVGAIITERVYVVPGAGNLLTEAINQYNNSVIVGMTLFYALLTVVSIIMGDILISMMDPRISFTAKKR